jgi:hypothetical protein
MMLTGEPPTATQRKRIPASKWSWCVTEWDELPERLAELEAEGEQIFAIVPEGDMGRYLRVIYRKRE